ncbi:MAG: response regulator transcription factor [Rubrivivax sp.]|nr:response regulator transcription factor [Rubrivivax sp.]
MPLHPPDPTDPPAAHGTAGLLVSDDNLLVQGLLPSLALQGCQLQVAGLTGTLTAGSTAPLRAGHARTVVIDLRQQTERGLLALESLRHHASPGQALALLALVPPGCSSSPQRALQAGADDFCCHAEDAHEILVRLRVIAQRQACSAAGAVLCVGPLALDPVARVVRRHGSLLELSARQFDLLHVLMRHPGEVLSRAQLEAELPPGNRERGSNVVEVHVHHLRRQIGDEQLATVRGQGYVLRAVPRP